MRGVQRARHDGSRAASGAFRTTKETRDEFMPTSSGRFRGSDRNIMFSAGCGLDAVWRVPGFLGGVRERDRECSHLWSPASAAARRRPSAATSSRIGTGSTWKRGPKGICAPSASGGHGWRRWRQGWPDAIERIRAAVSDDGRGRRPPRGRRTGRPSGLSSRPGSPAGLLQPQHPSGEPAGPGQLGRILRDDEGCRDMISDPDESNPHDEPCFQCGEETAVGSVFYSDGAGPAEGREPQSPVLRLHPRIRTASTTRV